MCACAKTVFLLLLTSLVPISGAAQQSQTRPNAPSPSTRQERSFRQIEQYLPTLTRDEGLAVLGAALDSRHNRAFTSDCSHFVHGLYQRAGFPYAYAPSTDLYSGIDQFQRVTIPQAGDLIVWRGHVGIVVNPAQSSFFSLLHSGAGVEHYDSPYWRRRGHPHFLRYVKGNPGSIVATSLRNANLTPAAGNDADPRELADNDSAPNSAEGSASDIRPARLRDTQRPIIPPVVVVSSAHLTPDQVRTAFLQSCADSEEILGGRNLLKSDQPLIVFDHFVVRKLHIAGTQGWAEVEFEALASVTAGRSETRNHSERQRWPLIHRTRTTWELTPPQRTIYLPPNVAAHITAQQLAQLTRDTAGDSDKTQKTELAQLLNVLLQK